MAEAEFLHRLLGASHLVVPLPGDVEAQLAELLGRVKGDDDARQRYLDLLELMGPDDPRTAEARKALSRELF